ncbi:unnamed protein product [Rodentolepis nana]|uniref:CCHC-type domain-containing protein n=1 Tax=Rodentolepis nana TaxID=102285 RepID=A0A0R3TJB7_RODNA|nr:unnamed protein product [Rodentolepis nana]
MSRYDPPHKKNSRKHKPKDSSPIRASHPPLSSHRRPLILTKCDQEITSPLCVAEGISDNDRSEASDATISIERSNDLPINSCVSLISQARINSRAQINTNYISKQGTCMCCDPSSIDKCTELEAMRRGLARIQAGHGRPSDFLPDKQDSPVDPYIKNSLEDIRRSIMEVKETKQNVIGNGTAETQLAGQTNPTSADYASSGQDSHVMITLHEIRNGIQNLTRAIEGVHVGTRANPNAKPEDAPVIEALGEIQRSLRTLLGFPEHLPYEQAEKHENHTVMGAINAIRTSIRQLETGAHDDIGRQQAGELAEAISEIRHSVRAMAGHSPITDDETTHEKSELTVDKVTDTMTKNFEELQKSLEKISELLMHENGDGKFQLDKEKCKREKKEKKKKHKRCRSMSDSESEDICTDSDSDRECCKDSHRFGKTCDKIIDFLISNEKKSGTYPQIQLLMPNQPPRFISPMFRPPPRPQMALPPPPPQPNHVPPQMYSPYSCHFPSPQVPAGPNAYQSNICNRYQFKQQPQMEVREVSPEVNLPPPPPLHGIAVPQMNTVQSQDFAECPKENTKQPILFKATVIDDKATPDIVSRSFIGSVEADENGSGKNSDRKFICTPVNW